MKGGHMNLRSAFLTMLLLSLGILVLGAGAISSTPWGLSGLTSIISTDVLGKFNMCAGIGADMWANPAPHSQFGQGNLVIGFGFVDRVEVYGAGGFSGRRVTPTADTGIDESGVGDTKISGKVKFSDEEETWVSMGFAPIFTLPTGEVDPNGSPLQERALGVYSEGQTNIAMLLLFSRHFEPREVEGSDLTYNLIGLHWNMGYELRLGERYYGIPGSGPGQLSIVKGQRPDIIRFGLGGEITPVQPLSFLIETTGNIGETPQVAGLTTEQYFGIGGGFRLNAQDFLHFGVTVNTYFGDGLDGALQNNWRILSFLTSDVPFLPEPKKEPVVVVTPPAPPPAPTPPPPPPPAPEPPKKPEIKKIVLEGLNFKPNKAELIEGTYSSLEQAAQTMKEYPDIKVLIAGHAANIGQSEFEMQLSQDRANTIKDMLVTRYGIAADRIETRGYGSTQPIADNSTEAGKKQNRRIEFIVKD
jgi:outer membrane protein OmpA-like peptidoglycan-associated protein